MGQTGTVNWTAVWTTVAALATLLAAIAAAAAAYYAKSQVHLARFSVGVDMLQRLDIRFDSDEFLQTRSDAAIALESLKTKKYAEDRALEGQIEPVLDFFETIGLLVRRKVLDPEMVHSTFFYWYYGYWLHAKPLIDRQRKKFPTRYGDFLELHGALVHFEERPINEDEWEKFLEDEQLEGVKFATKQGGTSELGMPPS